MNNSNLKSPTRILLAGEGGQGIQTIAKILADLAYQSNFEVSYMPHYGVEMRMGISVAYLQISQEEIIYPKFDIADILIVMTRRDLKNTKRFISKKTRVINCTDLEKILLEKNLSYKSFNIFTLGIILKELANIGINFKNTIIKESIIKYLGSKSNLEENFQALTIGQAIEEKVYLYELQFTDNDKFKMIIAQDNKKIHVKFSNLCKGCGLCIERCPVKALKFSKDEINYISRPLPEVDINKCIACGICQQVCPDCAIKIIKK